MDTDPWDSMFRQLEHAHIELARQFDPDNRITEGLREVRAGLRTEVERLGQEHWEQAPEPGEWSMRQMLEHVLTHDQRWEEAHRKGVAHYVDHGRLHVEQGAKICRAVLNGE